MCATSASSAPKVKLFAVGKADAYGLGSGEIARAAIAAGASAPIMGSRGAEHTVIDVTAIPEAAVGAEVVVLGRQGDGEITIAELSERTGVPMIELAPRLAHGSLRVYPR